MNIRTIFLYIGVFLGITIMLLAIIIFIKNDNNLVNTQGTITRSICSAFQDNRGTMYNCVLTVSYNAGNKMYEREIIMDDKIVHNKGDKIDVTYNINNPEQVTLKQIKSEYIGIILSVIAIIIIAIGYYIYYNFESNENNLPNSNPSINKLPSSNPSINKLSNPKPIIRNPLEKVNRKNINVFNSADTSTNL